MDCPKCKSQMETVTAEQIETNRCTSCGGLWFDLREHEHLKRIAGSEAVDSGDPARGKQQDQVRNIDCPRCHTKMIGLVFPDQPHIHYEMCSVCYGVYFDAGEFADYAKMTLAERVKYALGPLVGK